MEGRFSLQTYLTEQQPQVEAWLEAGLSDWRERVPSRLTEAVRYSLLAGGKRLRPLLCLAFARAVAPGNEVKGLPAVVAALEYVHTYSLIHDDLPAMDDDDLRRGRPTNHKVYGEAMAILAGDALLTEAFALLGPLPEGGRLCVELAQASGAAGMVGGQVMDIAEDRPAELAYLTRLHRLKTGALIRAACRMGVMVAGGSAEALDRATRYGEAVGLAFQVADDLLDVTADAQTLGKPAQADAAAGRFTFPAVLGLDGSRRLAAEQMEEALRAVASLEPVSGPLAALARYAVERSS